MSKHFIKTFELKKIKIAAYYTLVWLIFTTK